MPLIITKTILHPDAVKKAHIFIFYYPDKNVMIKYVFLKARHCVPLKDSQEKQVSLAVFVFPHLGR